MKAKTTLRGFQRVLSAFRAAGLLTRRATVGQLFHVAMLFVAAALLIGCKSTQETSDPRAVSVDEQVREKWGMGLDQLPTAKLVIISPHNENIEKEFLWAFSLHHALNHGEKVYIEWRDVGGGSSSIEQFLLNVYDRKDSSGIDIVWGGGEFVFRRLASVAILQPMKLTPDILDNIPKEFGGIEMYDEQLRWCGSAMSGFGFLYNATLLRRCGIEAPKSWDDLAKPQLSDLLALADPTQSGSAAAAYRMIVMSGRTWEEGWAKLLTVLSNAKRFEDSAGAAANAPLLGEALVATAIDFYGAIRVAQAPDELTYVSPKGQTAFTPDPIGILKNPPHPELSRRFVEFVLSRRGQALWAIRVGSKDGPIRNPLGRQPIRRDVYTVYRSQMLSWIVNPYEAGQALQIDPDKQQVHFGVLRQLVRAAAIDNLAGLRAARKRLIETNFPAQWVAEFGRLPENIDTLDEMSHIAKSMKDKAEAERIVTDWQRFFRDKYARIARSSP